MSDVRVTIGANSAPLNSEFDKVKASARGLKKSVGDAGGVLEGDRRVENKMTAWVDGFKTAQNGADLLANTMGNLGDVFKSSLAIGVGLNVGAALVGMFSDAIKESDELKKSAEATGKAIRDALASRDSGSIAAAMKTANDEMQKLEARMKSWKPTFSSPEGQGANLFAGQVELGAENIRLMKLQNQIQILLNQGHTEEAEKISETLRLEKEIAAEKLKGYALDTQLTSAIEELKKSSAERIAASKNKLDEEERAKRIKEADEKHKHVVEQQQKDIAAEKEAMQQFIEWEDEEEAKSRAEREKGEKESAASIASFQVQKEKEKWQAILDEATKQRKAIDDADKAALEGNQERLKEAQEIVKKGAEEQKQRDDKKVQGLLGGETLAAQRQNEKVADAAKDKAAGIAARDEVRRKYGGDATKMSKDEIEAVKRRILGEKQLNQKDIEAAARAIPEIQKAIVKLVTKLGVK